LVSLCVAWLLTVGLFWFLWVLIAAREEGTVVAAIPRIDFSRLRQDTDLQEVKRVKPQINEPEPPPSSPIVTAAKSAGVTAGVDVSALAPPGVDFSGMGGTGQGASSLGAQLAFGGGTDRDTVPQVQIEPDYPPAAKARGIEGWVTVQFDVGADGSTRNVTVVDAKPLTVFDRATVKAVSDWKYSPKIQDGKPVERKGLQVRLVFQMNEGFR
jgi:protein TonB